ncbi:MAG: hypothetical protein QN178_04500 [Armatimonadota bacterium]|nr:hypothetical protein [Armatimonadota bacterium]
MGLSTSEAYERIAKAARAVDPALVVDKGSIHWRDHPVPGVAYGLALKGAHALLFLPAADIAEPGWEQRLPSRLDAAHRYLLGFPGRAR